LDVGLLQPRGSATARCHVTQAGSSALAGGALSNSTGRICLSLAVRRGLAYVYDVGVICMVVVVCWWPPRLELLPRCCRLLSELPACDRTSRSPREQRRDDCRAFPSVDMSVGGPLPDCNMSGKPGVDPVAVRLVNAKVAITKQAAYDDAGDNTSGSSSSRGATANTTTMQISPHLTTYPATPTPQAQADPRLFDKCTPQRRELPAGEREHRAVPSCHLPGLERRHPMIQSLRRPPERPSGPTRPTRRACC